VLAVVLLTTGLVGAIARPWRVPAWVLPLVAAILARLFGVVSGEQLHAALRPLASPLAFILVAVPFAASLDDVGVFDELAARAARSRHVVGALWVLAGCVVALLNLDAAVVLLTPLYIRTALLVDVDPVALAFQPVLLASLASSVLVVSNLTNLIAAEHLALTNAEFLRHVALPSIAASAIGWLAYRRCFRVKARVTLVERAVDRRALVVGLGAIACFLGLLFFVAPWIAALIAEAGLLLVTRRVPLRFVPWRTVIVAAALAVLAAGVAIAFPDVFGALGRGGLRGFGAGVLAANVLNNLPAVIVGLPHVHVQSHVWPLLLGVNLGPTVLLTGSLAGLLWQAGAQRAGVQISALHYTRVGVRVGIPAMLAAAAVFFVLK